MIFSYRSGQRPLDGYTLKRGIGKGGFGEVYFAISDGGKEVALKLLRNHQEMELRGVAQCLNLKHPNLIHLYDLRTDSRGDQWVVMEYVVGESLHEVVRRYPDGLPEELAREWFLALAKAISHLHDHGIVHRDLKPANIFIENGVLKVGDYGLSKSISDSQGSEQTQSIGTVHYMAPEISKGNYNRQIDTYAAGIILYEMLTGHVPFQGQSAGEILMKHLTDLPDLSEIPKQYVPVLTRALSKNPSQRYASMNEMARAVEENAPPSAETAKVPPSPLPRREGEVQAEKEAALIKPSMGGTVGELFGSMSLAALFAAFATALWAGLSQTHSLTELAPIFFLTVAASWLVLIPTKFWTTVVEESWPRRLALLLGGVVLGAHALWLQGWTLPGTFYDPTTAPESPLQLTEGSGLVEALGYLSYFAIVFVALRWWKMTERQRPQRFSFYPVLATAFWAVILLLLWKNHHQSAVALVMASAIVQVVSPWEQQAPKPARRIRLRHV